LESKVLKIIIKMSKYIQSDQIYAGHTIIYFIYSYKISLLNFFHSLKEKENYKITKNILVIK